MFVLGSSQASQPLSVHEHVGAWSTCSCLAGASMAVGNGYASRVNALRERTQVRDQYLTPREQMAPRGGGNRYYPGSEKFHGPQFDRYDPQYDRYDGSHLDYGGHDQLYAGARTAPCGPVAAVACELYWL